MDGLTRPQRIADVLRHIDADIVALQEVVGSGPTGGGQAEEIGAALGMGWVMAVTRQLRGHLFGNVVLSRLPIRHYAQHNLTWRSREARCCQRVDLDVGAAHPLHVFNVHLGTAVLERRYQASRLAAFVNDSRTPGPKIVLGDFNEWIQGPDDEAPLEVPQERRPAGASATEAHVPRDVPRPAPRPHLLRRTARGHGHLAPADAALAGRLGPSAARRRHRGGVTVGTAAWRPATPSPRDRKPDRQSARRRTICRFQSMRVRNIASHEAR